MDSETFHYGNLFENIGPKSHDEQVDQLLNRRGCKVERIVSMGHCSPIDFWYQQKEDEWVLLVKGTALLRYQDPDELISLKPGDYHFIPANRKHRVESTDDTIATIWLAIFVS